jgi:hypothetical protein
VEAGFPCGRLMIEQVFCFATGNVISRLAIGI